jgi:hypothetical protein
VDTLLEGSETLKMHLSVEGGAPLKPRVRAPRQSSRVLEEAAWPLVDLASTVAVDSGIGLHIRNSAPQVSLANSASEKLQVHRHESQGSCSVTVPTGSLGFLFPIILSLQRVDQFGKRNSV